MNGVVLSEPDANLRGADEQVGVLLALYADPSRLLERPLDPTFLASRRAALKRLRIALRTELGERDILPKEQDDEVSAWRFLVDRLQGAIRGEALAIPLEEERKLLEICECLEVRTDSSAVAFMDGVRATREAVKALAAMRS